MEYVDGPSLAHYLQKFGKLPIEQVLPIGLPIARGLAAAHSHQIVHHDVKPGNILLGPDGSIKVSDFGVARFLTAFGGETELQIFGTPGYMPPEILRGQPYTPAGDLFGLGVLLFQSLTGEMPFAADQVKQVLLRTISSYTPRRATSSPASRSTSTSWCATSCARTRPNGSRAPPRWWRRLEELQRDLPPWRPEPGDLQKARSKNPDNQLDRHLPRAAADRLSPRRGPPRWERASRPLFFLLGGAAARTLSKIGRGPDRAFSRRGTARSSKA